MGFLKNAGRPDNCCPDCKPNVCDPCGGCSTAETLNLVFSGVEPCTCFDRVLSSQYRTTTITGLNGAHVATSIGLNQWQVVAAVTWTNKLYTTADCSGTPIFQTSGTANIDVVCDFAVLGYKVTVGGDFAIFDSGPVGGTLGVAMNNANTCQDEHSSGGTVTISE